MTFVESCSHSHIFTLVNSKAAYASCELPVLILVLSLSLIILLFLVESAFKSQSVWQPHRASKARDKGGLSLLASAY